MVGDGIVGARRLVIDTPGAPFGAGRPMQGITLRIAGEIPRGARRPVCFLRLAG